MARVPGGYVGVGGWVVVLVGIGIYRFDSAYNPREVRAKMPLSSLLFRSISATTLSPGIVQLYRSVGQVSFATSSARLACIA